MLDDPEPVVDGVALRRVRNWTHFDSFNVVDGHVKSPMPREEHAWALVRGVESVVNRLELLDLVVRDIRVVSFVGPVPPVDHTPNDEDYN